jgi:small subunit ribosomal protein S8
MDPISNMIIAMKNAGLSGHESVLVPYSKMKEAIANLLKVEGYVRDAKKVDRKGKPALEIDLILNKRVPRIQGTKRISKPSKRIYRKHSEIRPVKNGYGLLVMSTPKGIMSGYEAKKEHLGGEALFTIW